MNSKKKILLVDDDDLLRGIYANRFQDDGFEVMQAKNGQEAWQILSNGNIPDLIFTGIMMPVMGGFELIAKIKAVPSLANIAIAISSHRGLDEDRKKAQEMGVNVFLIQGETTPNEVSHRIKTLLGIKDVFRIEFAPEKTDGRALIDLLNRQQGTTCGNVGNQNMILEIVPKEKDGEFGVKLIC